MKILHIYFKLVGYSMTAIKESIKSKVEAHILYCNKNNLINTKSQKNSGPEIRKILHIIKYNPRAYAMVMLFYINRKKIN